MPTNRQTAPAPTLVDKGDMEPWVTISEEAEPVLLPKGHRDTGVPRTQWEDSRGAVEILRDPKNRDERNSREE